MATVKLIGMSGSLRAGSFSNAILETLREKFADRADLRVYDLAPIPAYNQDFEGDKRPPPVKQMLADIEAADGLVLCAPEFNHSIPGVLKNALDQAYKEWTRKPFMAIGYGGVGAARAIEHLRLIGVELQMVSTHAAVHIGGSDFMAIHPMRGKKPIEEIEANLLPSAKTALDELVWWTNALKAARAKA